MAASKRRRAALTVRQLVEDYLAHQLTRPVTRVSTRHHLTPLLAMFGGWQARRVGGKTNSGFSGRPTRAGSHVDHSDASGPSAAHRIFLERGNRQAAGISVGWDASAASQGQTYRASHSKGGSTHV